MASCASCGADGIAADKVCPRCGAAPSRGLELALRPPPAPKGIAPRRHVVKEVSFELAVDPRELVAQRAAESQGMESLAQGTTDVHTDARVLADYGEPPSGAMRAPLYAWRVLKRRRELRVAHAGRRAEVEHATRALEAELVALAERVRPAAEGHPAYARALEELRRAEALLRSRDQVLAAEQDAQQARLAQVDARLTRLEEELTQVSTEERMMATDLSSSQVDLAREEAKLKRAETELRAAKQRASDGKTP